MSYSGTLYVPQILWYPPADIWFQSDEVWAEDLDGSWADCSCELSSSSLMVNLCDRPSGFLNLTAQATQSAVALRQNHSTT